MIIRMFRVFDPTSFLNIKINWIIMIIVIMMFIGKYYLIKIGYTIILRKVYRIITIMFKEVANPNFLGVGIVCVITFMYLVFRNLIGLFPFIFTRTAHPKVTLGLGLVIWMSFFIIGWVKNFLIRAAHLVPEGSPILLAPFIVIIESVRHLIRPFTLSIRLAANIIAGHLIIGLLAAVRNIRVGGIVGSIILQRVLLLLEFAVGVIQGFVFRILILLYALEYY